MFGFGKLSFRGVDKKKISAQTRKARAEKF